MKTLLQIGAGNIGRACVGRLFSQSGFKIIFSDVNAELLRLIEQKKEYYIRLVGKTEENNITISGVDALPQDEEGRKKVFNEASIITTAVGVSILPKIAPMVASAIRARLAEGNTAPLNVIACENAVRASSSLKEHVYALLSPAEKDWCGGKVSFPDAATDSIVPALPVDNPLKVTGEFFAELIIEKQKFLGELSPVEGLLLEDNLDAFIERKLFTLNTGHAITAYLGYLAKKGTVDRAIADDTIRADVLGAMEESGAVLVRRYGFDEAAHAAYIQKIIKRFENPHLKDDVARVGREPLRKLSYNDRLIKPLRGALEYQLKFDCLLKGIRAAFLYDNPEDKDSVRLRVLLSANRLEAVYEVTGLHREQSAEASAAEKIARMLE